MSDSEHPHRNKLGLGNPNKLGLGNPNVIICFNRGEDYHKVPDPLPLSATNNHANGIPPPATVVQHIRENLEDSSINYPADSSTHFFIPRDRFSSCLNYQTITSVVDSLPCCSRLSVDEKRALVRQIYYGNTQSRYPCKKLLGVLIALNLQDDLLKLIKDGINDRCLPLQSVSKVSKDEYVLQCSNDSHCHRSINEYRKFTRMRISQWTYAVTAPYFQKPVGRHVHYILDHNDVLPIIKAGIPERSGAPEKSKSQDKNKDTELGSTYGGNSRVQSIRFHPSHFDFGPEEVRRSFINGSDC